MWLARCLVGLYSLWHGRLGLPGAGWLIRRMLPCVPALRAFPLRVPGVGTALLDFRDQAAFGLLNYHLGDFGTDTVLLRFLEKFLGPGSVYWDVGANVGYVCMHVASRGLAAAVQAFEPGPVALTTLQSLFAGHPFVRVHPVALGAADEERELQVLPGSSQISSLVRPLEHAQSLRLRIRQGDAFRREQQLPLPDVLKIDVEGFEPQVMAGLKETIAASRPVIFFEHGWLSDEQVRALQADAPSDYSLHFILHEGRLTTDFAQRRNGDDALLLPPERAACLG